MTNDGAGRRQRKDGRDLELVYRLEQLYTAVVSDCLDVIGMREQSMSVEIRPLWRGARLAGYAATAHLIAMDGPPEDRDDWYKLELEAVDRLDHGDVMVVAGHRGAYWGELLSTASRYQGAHGTVLDAYTRDSEAIIDMEFPTFAAGISPADGLGRIDVDAIGVEIECGGVAVRPGDLVLADYDGVVVVPIEVADEVITAAEEKVSGENMVRKKLADGMPIGEAFRAYGII